MGLLIKYPELAPLSLFLGVQQGQFVQHEPLFDPKNEDLLFIFGIFSMTKDLKGFLKKNPHIEVVFLVERVEELLFFVKEGLDKGLHHERIHVLWKQEGMEDEDWAEDIASKYPYEKVLFLQNGYCKERFAFLKKTILRKIVLETSVHKELLHYPKLCKNLFKNIYHITEAFDIGLWKDAFKGVRAVVCGAGPSLSGQKKYLEQICEHTLIFAGGSTITALDQMGIRPHLAFAIDPNTEEYNRLRHSHCFTTPLIYGTRVQKDIFRFFSGPYGYMRTETGGLFEVYLDDALGIKNYGILKHLSEEAMSVTTIALMTAIYLGCDPIYFAGVDLSTKNSVRYSGNILSSWENSLEIDRMQEIKWMMEKEVIDQVKISFPERSFFDATGQGCTFTHIEAKQLELKGPLIARNLVGEIETLCKKTAFCIPKSTVQQKMVEIKHSLDDLSLWIKKYLEGDIAYSLFSYEIEFNQSYKLFFQGMVLALIKPLQKKLGVEGEALAKQLYERILKEVDALSSLIL